MKRLGILAHYDAQGEVKGYILYLLEALRPLCDRLVFVSTARLDAPAVARAERLCDQVVARHENTGFDFRMWQSVLLSTRLDDYDALLLANSSVFGPVFALEPIVRRMEAARCDFWSMTENFEHTWHLQSYFLGFKKNLLRAPEFLGFWRSVQPWRHKQQVIQNGEVALTVRLSKAGFTGLAAFPLAALAKHPSLAGKIRRWQNNPTTWHPAPLLDCGMPFVKVSVLRTNPCGISLRRLRRKIRSTGYDERLIAFDRPPDPARFVPGRLRRIMRRRIEDS